jgi:hypothetical protein
MESVKCDYIVFLSYAAKTMFRITVPDLGLSGFLNLVLYVYF